MVLKKMKTRKNQTFINFKISRADYGAAVKLEITNTEKETGANLILTSITALSFVFVLKKLL